MDVSVIDRTRAEKVLKQLATVMHIMNCATTSRLYQEALVA